MIGIVLVTYGTLAEAFIEAAREVVGEQRNIKAVCIDADREAETYRQELIQAVKLVDSGKGVVILTDMFGGAPSNLAISLLEQEQVEVVAGVNLPMLVKLISARDSMPLKQALLAAQEAGRKYINIASNLLEKRDKTGS